MWENKTITKFSLFDFEEFLTDTELIKLSTDEELRERLQDRFLECMSWHEAAKVAVEIWREENHVG